MFLLLIMSVAQNPLIVRKLSEENFARKGIGPKYVCPTAFG
jgi:hypothetical protein